MMVSNKYEIEKYIEKWYENNKIFKTKQQQNNGTEKAIKRVYKPRFTCKIFGWQQPDSL